MKTTEQAVAETSAVQTSGYIKTWGKIFSQFGTEGREVCVQKMIELFPQKSEGIVKWADWYKAFYNMGKILGYTNPVKISWRKVA